MGKSKVGLDLTVTYRSNVKTSSPDDWRYISIDEYLDIVEFNKELENKSDEWNRRYNRIEGWVTSSEEIMDDYVIIPQNLKEPLKSEYKENKRLLPCVHYFGRFTPPSNKIGWDGQGNGIVVLDIDFKHLGGDEGIPSAFKEKLEEVIVDFFIQHPSSIFLYETSSHLGYHIGYLTEATNSTEYQNAFNQLADELSEAISTLKAEGVIDRSVGRFNANFFTNHSDLVYRKHPDFAFKPTAVAEVEPPVDYREKETEKLQEDYDDFPYHTDFRLYLAYCQRENGVYFDNRKEWLTMLYALKAEFPIGYRSRIKDWFIKLSSLSPKFDEITDLELFETIIDAETEKKAGIDFIIKVLQRGQPVNQSPGYTLDDLQSYFDDLDDEDSADAYASNFVFINRYLSEIKEILNFYQDLNQNLIIESPPNTGKSTLFLQNVSFKRIYLVPTKVLLTDLAKNVQSAQIVQEGVLSSDIQAREVILSTYEGMEKILQSELDLTEYTLIVDEAHNIFLSASPSFRFLPLHRICNSFHRFKNAILLSGTWIDLPFSDQAFTLIKVKQKDPISTELNIINTETPLNNLSKDVATEPGKQIVLINNKDENVELKELVQRSRPDAVVTLMNADTKKKEEVKNILNNNHLQPGHILIGTQMIVEGISFLDEDIMAIRFYRSMAAEHIAQLSFRARKSHAKPPISFYQSRSTFFLKKESALSVTYDKLWQGYATKNPLLLASEFVGNSNIRVFYDRKTENDRPKDVYTPLIFDGNISDQVHMSKLLIGYLSLDEVAMSANVDLFSLLAALRKWSFTFSFINAEKATVREDFKKQRTEEQKAFIVERLDELSGYKYEEVSHNIKSPIYKAWCLLQCIEVGYFNNMNPEQRIKQFFDRKELQKLCDQVQGFAVAQGKQFLQIADLASESFYVIDAKILTDIKNTTGYPNKISNKSLDRFANLGLTKNDVKKVLKKHFTLTDLAPQKDDNNISVRHFKLEEPQHGFEPYVNLDSASAYSQDSPF